jgi:hypothetical protein
VDPGEMCWAPLGLAQQHAEQQGPHTELAGPHADRQAGFDLGGGARGVDEDLEAPEVSRRAQRVAPNSATAFSTPQLGSTATRSPNR